MVMITEKNIIQVFATPQELFFQAAVNFAARAITAIETKGEFTVVLAGGNTPKLLFDNLIENESNKKNIPWDRIKFFFGDERYVSSDNPASNYHMAYEYLFKRVSIPKQNIYRIPIEFGYAEDVAKEYERILRMAFPVQNNEIPQFDLIYLGLGEDGHTASLMPGSASLKKLIREEKNGKWDKGSINAYPWVSSVWHSSEGIYQRITLTPMVINNAASIVFMVAGGNKANAVSEVLEGPENKELYPAQLIHCEHTKNVWYLDQAAASQLKM